MRMPQSTPIGRTGINRRPLFRVILTATLLSCTASGSLGDGRSLQTPSGAAHVAVVWRPTSKLDIFVRHPEISADGHEQSQPSTCRVQRLSNQIEGDRASFVYQVSVAGPNLTYGGEYRVGYSVTGQPRGSGLVAVSELTFDRPLPVDLTVTQAIEISGGRQIGAWSMPLRSGEVRLFEPADRRSASAYFVLGRQAAARRGHELAVPVIDVRLAGTPGLSLALAADPYCGSQFELVMPNGADGATPRLGVTTTHAGSIVPVRRERRTLAVTSHDRGIDGMFESFYDTIPEIEPGSPWIHEIQLNYYDYLSDQGQGWFDDLEELARRIPAPLRGSVVASLHGWYDYLGRYSFDRKTGQLEGDWIAFPRTRKTPISLDEIDKRIRFAKDLGFRVVLYFADGLNADSGAPGFREDWLIRNELGDPQAGWTGPSTGSTYVMDPANPEVRRFLLDYADAILRRFGRQIDGLVWDETLYITQERLSSHGGTPAYADRDFMTLVASLARRVQEYRETNPDLVLLTSDCLGVSHGGGVPYALVSHGTYQDTACDPNYWAQGLLPNYRNCLWSCNWSPITNFAYNRIAAEEYGLPQGLSNGYGDDVGPAKMPEKLLDDVIRLFLKRAAEGGGKRYVTGQALLNPALAPSCTTQEDAAGGCDGVKNGTWGFCTEKETDPWWQVDLGAAKPIERILIFNRCDGNVEGRAARLIILLSIDAKTWTEGYRHDGTPFFGFTDGKPLHVSLDGSPARYVRIQLPQHEYLHLDEIEVHAVGKEANVALGCPADQSSVSRWSVAQPGTEVETEDE